MGMDPELFGMHTNAQMYVAGKGCYRIPNAVPGRLFKRHGRWRQPRMDGYVKDSVARWLAVTKSLGI